MPAVNVVGAARTPGRLDDLVADEQALRDPSTPEPELTTAARRQQIAYRAIGRHPDWDAVVRPRIPPSLLRLMSQEIRLDSRAAQTALGIAWKELDASFSETARWFAQRNRRA